MLADTIRSNLWKYYVISFLSEFTIFLPFIVYYFQELGFSLGQIALLQSISAITMIIFEIPSGYIADKIGRKKSLIIATLFQLSGLIILYSSQNYSTIVIAHVFNGLAWAFASGADTALIYDSLLFLKRPADYKKIQGRANFFGEIAIILSAVLGSLIVAFGIRQTILFTMIAYTMQVFVTFSLTEPPRKKMKQYALRQELHSLASIIQKTFHNKKLLGLFCYSFIILGVSNMIFIMYQPYFRATTLPLYYYGFVFAAFSIFAGFTALNVHAIEERLGVYWSLVLMPVFLACSLIGASFVFLWFGFVFFFLRELVRGYVFPVLGDYTNKIVSSADRATVLSIGSMFARFGLVIIATTFGFFTDSYGLKTMLVVTGAILLLFTVLVPLLIKHTSTQSA